MPMLTEIYSKETKAPKIPYLIQGHWAFFGMCSKKEPSDDLCYSIIYISIEKVSRFIHNSHGCC